MSRQPKKRKYSPYNKPIPISRWTVTASFNAMNKKKMSRKDYDHNTLSSSRIIMKRLNVISKNTTSH